MSWCLISLCALTLFSASQGGSNRTLLRAYLTYLGMDKRNIHCGAFPIPAPETRAIPVVEAWGKNPRMGILEGLFDDLDRLVCAANLHEVLDLLGFFDPFLTRLV